MNIIYKCKTDIVESPLCITTVGFICTILPQNEIAK